MKKTIMTLAVLLAAATFADRTANRDWVEANFARKGEAPAERRHALFIIELNAEAGGYWRSFELKASTNNFARVPGVEDLCFWCCSDEADGYADETVPLHPRRSQDGMRIYHLTARGPGGSFPDTRAWTRVATTIDVGAENPMRLAVIVSPDLCRDGDWLREGNEEIVWCYARAHLSGAETGPYGDVVWHPVQPVKWLRDLPEWARQE